MESRGPTAQVPRRAAARRRRRSASASALGPAVRLAPARRRSPLLPGRRPGSDSPKLVGAVARGWRGRRAGAASPGRHGRPLGRVRHARPPAPHRRQAWQEPTGGRQGAASRDRPAPPSPWPRLTARAGREPPMFGLLSASYPWYTWWAWVHRPPLPPRPLPGRAARRRSKA